MGEERSGKERSSLARRRQGAKGGTGERTRRSNSQRRIQHKETIAIGFDLLPSNARRSVGFKFFTQLSDTGTPCGVESCGGKTIRRLLRFWRAAFRRDWVEPDWREIGFAVFREVTDAE